MKNGRAIVLTRKLHGQTTTTDDDDRHYDYNTPLCRGVKMKDWLLKRYASSTFNKCTHQLLPSMTGPPLKIHIDPNAVPVAVNTPVPETSQGKSRH